jgi:hypothetical protein
VRLVIALCLIVIAYATPALAHSSARGFVLLLPTGYVILGGTLAVLVTFAAVSLLPDRFFHGLVSARKALFVMPRRLPLFVSLISASFLAGLIWIGFNGPHDPAANLLPLVIWTMWWVVIVLLHPVFGNIWVVLNPFSGLHALSRTKAPLQLPGCLDYVPAIVMFAAFAWYQLVYPSPEDPARLAISVSVYAAFSLAGIFLFGPKDWMAKGDPFGVFFSQLGAAAPLSAGLRVEVHFPGARLASRNALPVAGTLFVLLTLSSISFDGFANTFQWLSSIGINPLDFPGRTALVPANTLGLAASFAALAAFYTVSITLGWIWSGRPGALGHHMGRFIYALIPISVAYHFAHYVSDTLVNVQYLALALNDPLGTGANLLGIGSYHVTASFQNTASGTLVIFVLQTCAIVLGHIISVAVAHAIAIQSGLTRANVWRLEAPLAALMVLYTAFGLWLLATPSIG